MAAKLERTKVPGIFRRHVSGCEGGRCDCAYVVRWRHRGQQQVVTVPTMAEAREVKGRRDSGDRRPVGRVRLGDYFHQWIETYAGRTARGFSETTRPEYRRPIEQHVLPRWATWRLADVEPADVRGLFGELRKTGATTSAIRKLRVAISAMFATAVEDGLIRSNPVNGVRIPAALDNGPEDDRPKAMTRSELALLLGALPDDRWRLFFEFMAHTGLRIGEVVGLTWGHVVLGPRPRVQVREQVYRGKRRRLKSRHSRRDVPLSPSMAARLAVLRRDSFRGEDSPVFPSTTGTPLSPHNVRGRVLEPAALSVGFAVEGRDRKGRVRQRSSVTFKSFRHTCASLLFEAGRNVRQVSEWLGHSDPGFTLRTYIHLMDEGIGDAAFMDEAVRVTQDNTGTTRRIETAANRAAADPVEIAS